MCAAEYLVMGYCGRLTANKNVLYAPSNCVSVHPVLQWVAAPLLVL